MYVCMYMPQRFYIDGMYRMYCVYVLHLHFMRVCACMKVYILMYVYRQYVFECMYVMYGMYEYVWMYGCVSLTVYAI